MQEERTELLKEGPGCPEATMAWPARGALRSGEDQRGL